jgi:16S rRNA (cytosine967-C5)-methyltransferase
MPVDLVRDAAIDVLLRVFERDAYLNVSLDRTLRRKNISDRGRRFLTQLVYGTVRHKLLVDSILTPLLSQPLDKLPPAIHCILRMGVFQSLFCNQVTFPAMVHTSVDLAKKRGNPGTARLVNAVLKRAPQSIDDVKLPDPETERVQYLRVRYSMPRWLIRLWIEAFGDETTSELCRATDEPAATALRTNTLRTTPEALKQALNKSGYAVTGTTSIPEELTVAEGPPPARSKRFMDGHFIIQDPASMLPAHLLEPQAGDRVLDMCAAPGGKSTHLAQLAQDQAAVFTLDVHAGKLDRVLDNMERLGIGLIFPVCGDGRHLPFGLVFDRVLVDAPCSGLGTLRRHPELKWRSSLPDVEELAVQQRELLRSAIQVCENGGVIVYSVCTVTPQETDAVLDDILQTEAVTAEDGPEWMDEWKIAPGRYRTLPVPGGMDGFFLTRLRKSS